MAQIDVKFLKRDASKEKIGNTYNLKKAAQARKEESKSTTKKK